MGRPRPYARTAPLRDDPPRPGRGARRRPSLYVRHRRDRDGDRAGRSSRQGQGRTAHGASLVQQAIRARLLDELVINLVPVVLGRGVRLLDNLEPGSLELERVIDAPGVTHLTYRVVR